ncbi:hypothetical protein Catovirus_1_576 [Catovirus CTV1]|uniref:Uncharacterized protein n=1 Tax=Catovirus CTV1 TaxID=1977631 RepID=A0A1V0S9Y9_9VIRU|nr:hypothetical protein Catovirus_1_576 [Catovirus CTV1]
MSLELLQPLNDNLHKKWVKDIDEQLENFSLLKSKYFAIMSETDLISRLKKGLNMYRFSRKAFASYLKYNNEVETEYSEPICDHYSNEFLVNRTRDLTQQTTTFEQIRMAVIGGANIISPQDMAKFLLPVTQLYTSSQMDSILQSYLSVTNSERYGQLLLTLNE